MKKIAAALLLTVMLSSTALAEGTVREIYEDAFYGGLTGTIIGGALMAFTRKPAEHLSYLGYGGAVGVLAGAGYGLLKTSRAFADVDNGKIRFAMPTIMPDIKEPNSKGQVAIVWNAEIIRGNF